MSPRSYVLPDPGARCGPDAELNGSAQVWPRPRARSSAPAPLLPGRSLSRSGESALEGAQDTWARTSPRGHVHRCSGPQAEGDSDGHGEPSSESAGRRRGRRCPRLTRVPASRGVRDEREEPRRDSSDMKFTRDKMSQRPRRPRAGLAGSRRGGALAGHGLDGALGGSGGAAGRADRAAAPPVSCVERP